jgi:hypothetical protein
MVWTDDDEDSPGTLDRAADVGDIGRPGVLLIGVIAALRLDDDREGGLAGRRVVEGDDGIGGEFGGDDIVQVGRAKPSLQTLGQRNV